MNRRSLVVPTGRLRPVSVVLAAVVLVGAAVSTTYSWATSLPGDVVVRVGGEDVTIATLDRRIDVLSAIYGVTAPEGGEDLEEFRRASAKSVAVSTVLENVAEDRDVAIANKTLQDELTKIIEEQNGDRESFVQFLGEKGLKETDILDELRRSRLTERLYAEVTADVEQATPDDAKQEYQEREDEIRTEERRQLANIVVESEDEASAVMERLDDGDDFADVAASTSLDTTTAQEGGDLGQEVTRTNLEPAYADAAFTADKGEAFGPVQTESGWNVGRVLDVTPGEKLSYEDVEETLVDAITSRRQLAVWTEWLNDQIAAAGVEYAEDFRPEDENVTTIEAEEEQR